MAIGCTGFFGLTFWITGKIVRKELRLNASKIALANTLQIKLIQEGLGAIRDILLDGNQNIYVQSYQQCERPLRSLSARNQYLSSFPRYVLEALGMVVLSLLGWFLTDYYENPASVIPLLGLFCFSFSATFTIFAINLFRMVNHEYICSFLAMDSRCCKSTDA